MSNPGACLGFVALWCLSNTSRAAGFRWRGRSCCHVRCLRVDVSVDTSVASRRQRPVLVSLDGLWVGGRLRQCIGVRLVLAE